MVSVSRCGVGKLPSGRISSEYAILCHGVTARKRNKSKLGAGGLSERSKMQRACRGAPPKDKLKYIMGLT